MATSEATRTRAPRGAKAVVSAFLAALNDIPDARRVEVAKAAQVSIRDEVKTMTVKAKEASKPAPRKAAAAKKTTRKAPAAAAKKTVAPMRRAKRASAAAAA